MAEQWFKTAELIDAERRAGIRMSAIEDEGTVQEESQLSGTNRSTIGDTFIPQDERRKIRAEVQAVMRQNFPGIHMSTVHNSERGNSAAPSTNVKNPGQNSVPIAIEGQRFQWRVLGPMLGLGKTRILLPE